MRKNILIFLFFLFVLLMGCGDIIETTIQKQEAILNPVEEFYNKEAASFTAIQAENAVELLLAWANPIDAEFSSVLIIRKTGAFPDGIDDPQAVYVYIGNSESCTDSNLVTGNIYYYMLYTRDADLKYSRGVGVFNRVISLTPSPTVYGFEALSFTATQVTDTSISLTWTNPVDADFEKMVILRKIDTFPTSYDDASADIIYSDSVENLVDDNLTNGTTYCYAIYAKSTESKYSAGRMQSCKVLSAAEILYDYCAGEFSAVQGEDNRETILTWVNPIDSNFSEVRLLRKTTGYPTAYNDGTATVVYTGTNERYTDSGLTPGTSYYYSIYTKDTSSKYSQASTAYRAVTETVVDIRRRSFFIIGGSSSYPTTPASFIVTNVDMFDPLTETVYSAVTTLSPGRYFCEVASVGGKIYVFGGFSSTGAAQTTVDILDVDTLTWTSGVVLPAARAAHRVAEWNNKIYTIFGTSSATAVTTGVTADGRRFDPLTTPTSWLTDTNNIYKDLTTARCLNVAEVLNGVIYYYGGVNATGAFQTTGGCYNIDSNTELAMLGTGNPNYGSTSAMYYKKLDNGTEAAAMFVIGGSGAAAVNTAIPHPLLTFLAATNVVFFIKLPSYNAAAPTRLQLTGLPGVLNVNRAYAGAETYGNYIYIFGGVIQTNAISSIERLNVNNGNPTEGWQTITATLPTNRYGFGITKVKN